MKSMLVLATACLSVFAFTARADEPTLPLYALKLPLTDQSAVARSLDMHRGHVVLATMFYGRCPMACPLLIDTIKSIENSLTPAERSRLRVLMISVDPEHDTPQALTALAKQRRIDLTRWTLARASREDVRLLAAALDVQYRQLPDGSYNHTSVITLVQADGRLAQQTSLLGRADTQFVEAVREALDPMDRATAGK